MSVEKRVISDPAISDLDKLEASGLIKIAAVQPELEYLFRHWLIQQTAYSSLLKRERRRLHLSIANTLEAMYPDRLDELAPSLARHFDEAGQSGRTLPYLLRAGKAAAERHGLHEAAGFFLRAIELLSDSQDPQHAPMRIEVALGAVEAGWTFVSPALLMRVLEQAIADAGSLADRKVLANLVAWMVTLRRHQGERYGTSRELTELTDRLRAITEETGDESIRALPLARLGTLFLFSGLVEEGSKDLAEAVPLLERQGKSLEAAFALGVLSIFYARMGEFQKAEEASRRQAEIAQTGDPVARMDVILARANIELIRGNLDLALELGQTCTYQADELGVTACAIGGRVVVGAAQLMKGQPELAMPHFERGDELSLVSWKFWRPLLRALLITARAMKGERQVDEAEWQAALDNAAAVGDPFVEANIRDLRASVLAEDPEADPQQVLADLETAARIYEEGLARPYLARTLKTYGSVLRRLGRGDEARRALERSLALFEQVGLAEEAGQTRALLAKTDQALK